MKKIFIAILTLGVLSVFSAFSKEKKPVEPFDRGIGMSRSVFIPKEILPMMPAMPCFSLCFRIYTAT